MQNLLNCSIVPVRANHGSEFSNNVQFGDFCEKHGISHNFAAPRTSQNNEILERINHSLQEMCHAMISEQSIPQKFWCYAFNSTIYIRNITHVRKSLNKTPYEILRGKKTSLGYSQTTKAYIIFDKKTLKVKESSDITFNENIPETINYKIKDDQSRAPKQTTLAISTTKAEYVAAGRACQQALWMNQAIKDYDIHYEDVLVLCNYKGAIDLSKNPVHHSRTKHIKIRHHSLRDSVQKGNILMEKVASEDNIADILTKPLKPLKRFDLENAKSIKTPMSTDLKLTLDKDVVSVDSSKYRCMIGSLLYLTDYRPDIMFSVSLCARFQDKPKESHMDVVL
ncbi:retrovirus-related pol polyprotein from transposon TNT 1-94 [Tanacetum coccineum]